MATRNKAQQTRSQVRGFVFIWTIITLIMGMATFLAIYYAYQPNIDIAPQVASNNLNNNSSGAPVIIPSQTSLPATNTVVPQATNTTAPEPTTEEATTDENVAVAQAQPATEVPTDIPPTDIPQPTPVPPDEDETFNVGIQIQVPPDNDPEVMNGWFRTAQQMNLNWTKIQVRWELIEEVEGEYDWEALDLAMGGARFFGIRPMLSIVTAPDWSREAGANLEEHGPPADNADYVDFVRDLLERYTGQVYGIEVWNEQNLSREWTSPNGLSATNYVSLLRDTYNMVQEVSPGTIVISGALAPTGINDGIGAVDDFVYMEQMIAAGMLDVTDCVGAHHNGYNIGPLVRFDSVPNDPTAEFRGPFDNPHHSWSFRSTIEGYTSRIRAAGYDTKQCITEFGWAVSEDLTGTPQGFEYARDNTLEEQAQYFVEALDWMSSGDDVWLAFIWNLNYAPQAGWDPTNDNVPYSLIGPGNTFRPAHDAIRDWMATYNPS